jgi:Skp family chaperone for outer membrane proteins
MSANSTTSQITLRVSPLAAALLLGATMIGATAWNVTARPAESALAPAPVTVAIVEVARVMNGLNELKERNDIGKIRGAELEKKLQEVEQTIKNIDAELETVIPKNDTKRRTQAMADKFEAENLLKARFQAYKQLLDLENGDIIRDIYAKVILAIEDFAKKNNYDLVLLDDRGMMLPPVGGQERLKAIIENKRILFAKPELDITDRIITIMNNDHAAQPKP